MEAIFRGRSEKAKSDSNSADLSTELRVRRSRAAHMIAERGDGVNES